MPNKTEAIYNKIDLPSRFDGICSGIQVQVMYMALQEERTIQSFTCSGQSRRNDYRKLQWLALKCKSAAEVIFFCFENVHLSMYTETFFKGQKAGIKQMVNICGPPLLVGLATKVAEEI